MSSLRLILPFLIIVVFVYAYIGYEKPITICPKISTCFLYGLGGVICQLVGFAASRHSIRLDFQVEIYF